jgi:hypothetical protein
VPTDTDPLPPLKADEVAEAVALWRELQAARAAGVKLVLVTLRRDGMAVGYVAQRIDVMKKRATLDLT